MPCRRMTVKDVMRSMREGVKRSLTPTERRIAAVTAQQTMAFVCKGEKRSGAGLRGTRARRR